MIGNIASLDKRSKHGKTIFRINLSVGGYSIIVKIFGPTPQLFQALVWCKSKSSVLVLFDGKVTGSKELSNMNEFELHYFWDNDQNVCKLKYFYAKANN